MLRVLDAMKTGKIKSGERLVERDVALRFGVSRAPVRDAFHKLENLGVIERRSARGVHVRSWSDADAAEILLIADALIYLSVQLGADRMSDDDLAEMESNLAQTRKLVETGSVDAAAPLKLDLGFHLIIARASGNKRLLELLESLILPIEIYPDRFKARIDARFSLRQHQALLETLKRRDRKAAVQRVVENFEEGLREAEYRFNNSGSGSEAAEATASVRASAPPKFRAGGKRRV